METLVPYLYWGAFGLLCVVCIVFGFYLGVKLGER